MRRLTMRARVDSLPTKVEMSIRDVGFGSAAFSEPGAVWSAGGTASLLAFPAGRLSFLRAVIGGDQGRQSVSDQGKRRQQGDKT